MTLDVICRGDDATRLVGRVKACKTRHSGRPATTLFDLLPEPGDTVQRTVLFGSMLRRWILLEVPVWPLRCTTRTLPVREVLDLLKRYAR